MNTPERNTRQTRLDDATSQRLAKLRTVPVDSVGFLKAIEAQIPRSQARPRIWFSPIRTVAASLLVVGLIIALVVHSSSGPVVASAERLAEIHKEVLTGM